MQLSTVERSSDPGPGEPVAEAADAEVLWLRAENRRLRDRLKSLGEVSLRINSTQDLDSVMQGVIDGARVLTGARYGALITFDASGGIHKLHTSGIAAEEFHRLDGLPKGDGLLGYLNEIEGPLRLKDLASHPRSGGFPPGHPPMRSFLGCPLRHQEERLGNIYLTEKEDGQEFTFEDDELIVNLSALAAAALLNTRSYQALLKAKSSLQTLIDLAPVGVMLYDAKTMDLLSLNPEVRRMVRGLQVPGRSLDELRSVIDVRYPNGGKIEFDRISIERARRTGETVRSEEVVLYLADGRTVTALSSAAPIYSEDGEIVSVVAILQDMTPLEDLDRARAQFLGMVSEGLRHPLIAIKGATAVALDSSPAPDAAETQQYLRIIDENTGRMRLLINNLLDFTRMETGAFSVDPRAVDLAGLVEEAKGTFLRSGARNSVEVEISPDLPRVQADSSRLVQALGNLLTNAARCSADWSVIRVNVATQDARVSVSVSSEGWRVSTERLPYFFEWISGPADEEPDFGGEDQWLGLAICKGIVEAHGGHIWAESNGPGSGARVTFTIPVHAAGIRAGSLSETVAGTSSAGTSSGGRVRILVVGDEPQSLRNIQRTCSEAGYETIVALTAGEAESLAADKRPDLVLLSPALPGTNGAELNRRFMDFSDAPVVFLLDPKAGPDGPPALAAGAADFIVKPFSPTELAARVETALERRRTLPEGARRQEPYLLGDLEIDYLERRVTMAGRPLRLTATEYELLSQLSANAGRVLTHEQLLRLAWGADYPNDPRLLRSFIKKLRGKLGDDADNPVYILTEPRVGYRMAKAGGGEVSDGDPDSHRQLRGSP